MITSDRFTRTVRKVGLYRGIGLETAKTLARMVSGAPMLSRWVPEERRVTTPCAAMGQLVKARLARYVPTLGTRGGYEPTEEGRQYVQELLNAGLLQAEDARRETAMAA